jgi:hypothetical protein
MALSIRVVQQKCTDISGERTIKKHTETLTDASKEVGLQINAEKTKYIMLLSRHQNSGQNWNVKIANRLFKNVTVQIFVYRTKPTYTCGQKITHLYIGRKKNAYT